MSADYKADSRTREERHREVIAQQLADAYPRRCTCSTPSWHPDDHANTCPLGPTPPTSSNPTRPVTRHLPEEMF